MVGSIGSTSNLVSIISSLTYQQSESSSQETTAVGTPPPPPPKSPPGGEPEDFTSVFSTVDTDSDNAISESEFNTLAEGIAEVTGSEFSGSFLDFDQDADGQLNIEELKSVLNEAGFAPPPPPPQQVASAYEAQADAGDTSGYQTENESLMAQLLEYLETRSGDLDITA